MSDAAPVTMNVSQTALSSRLKVFNFDVAIVL